MSEQKVAVGVCQEISEKSGFTSFHINIGKQYPVRLTTKKDEIISAGRTAQSQKAVMEWHYNESDSKNINPNNNQPYKDRWLEKIVPVSGDGVPSSPVNDSRAEVDWDGKERRIVREACLKVAGGLVAASSDASEPGLATITLAERFETWVYRDFDEPPF